MKRMYHVHLRIREMIDNLNDMHRALFPGMDDYQIVQSLFRMLGRGQEVYPVRDCNNFDPVKGCQGHEAK